MTHRSHIVDVGVFIRGRCGRRRRAKDPLVADRRLRETNRGAGDGRRDVIDHLDQDATRIDVLGPREPSPGDPSQAGTWPCVVSSLGPNRPDPLVSYLEKSPVIC